MAVGATSILESQYLTFKDAAQLYRIAESTLRHYRADGRLNGANGLVTIAGHVRIDRELFEREFIQRPR